MSCRSTPGPCSRSKTSRCVQCKLGYRSALFGGSASLFFFLDCTQVDVYMNENAGINSLLVKGGLSTKALANAITTKQTEKEVENAAA